MRKYLLLLTLLLAFFACRHRSTEAKDSRLPLTVSVEPLRYFVESIASERFRVQTLMPAGSSPETYEPTPWQMMDLAESRAYFRFGSLGFEQTRLEKITSAAQGLDVFDVDEGIVLLPSHGSSEGNEADQHIWTSVSNACVIVRNICVALCSIDSLGKDYYEARADSMLCLLDSLDEELNQLTKPLMHRTFLIQHPALGYFARDYGLRQLAVEQNGKQPTPSGIADLIKTCKADSVAVVFIQPQHSGKAARQIAREVGAEVVEVNPLAYNWPEELRSIARALNW